MSAMTISELARAGGVGVETIRFYQRRGLLADPAPARSGRSGRRHYGPDEVGRLRFIRAAQQAGFSLAEIGELLVLDAGNDRPRVREMARARIAELDGRIAQLAAARAALQRLAIECGRGGEGPCPILSAFDAGSSCRPGPQARP